MAKTHLNVEIKNRICGLCYTKLSYPEMQNILKKHGIQIPLSTIQRIGYQFKTTGSVKRKPGSGRPRKTTSRENNRLKFEVIKDRKKTITKLAEEFKNGNNETVSRKTIARRLKDLGFASMRCARKPFYSKKNIKDRLNFYNLYGMYDSQWFQYVFWSDECRFELHSDAPERCLRRSTEKYFTECISTTKKHGAGGIMVWGIFSASGVGELIRCSGSINAKEYQRILDIGLLPSIEKLCTENERQYVIFQQDNAPAHTAKTTKAWLKKKGVPVMFWPGQSPDLNPIENIWAYIKAKLAGKNFNTPDQLWKAVEKEWKTINAEHCQRLSYSLPKRLKLLKLAKWKYIPY